MLLEDDLKPPPEDSAAPLAAAAAPAEAASEPAKTLSMRGSRAQTEWPGLPPESLSVRAAGWAETEPLGMPLSAESEAAAGDGRKNGGAVAAPSPPAAKATEAAGKKGATALAAVDPLTVAFTSCDGPMQRAVRLLSPLSAYFCVARATNYSGILAEDVPCCLRAHHCR